MTLTVLARVSLNSTENDHAETDTKSARSMPQMITATPVVKDIPIPIPRIAPPVFVGVLAVEVPVFVPLAVPEVVVPPPPFPLLHFRSRYFTNHS